MSAPTPVAAPRRHGRRPDTSDASQRIVIDLRSADPTSYDDFPGEDIAADRGRVPDDRLRQGLAIMAHEVRGPLLAARAAIELALVDEEISADGGGLLGRACREIDRVARYVDRLVRWESKLQHVALMPTDLLAIVHDAAETCVFETGHDRVRVHHTARPVVDVDPDHLRMALANLIRNALQYSPKETEVDVSVDVDGDHAVITVSDSGPGILEDEQQAIFGPFVRGSASSGTGGGGIGLFFTRSVIQALRGSVGVESTDTGTSFQVWLPLTRREVVPSES